MLQMLAVGDSSREEPHFVVEAVDSAAVFGRPPDLQSVGRMRGGAVR